jgi:hypothetical protein
LPVSFFSGAPRKLLKSWCRRRDLNPHGGEPHRILSLNPLITKDGNNLQYPDISDNLAGLSSHGWGCPSLTHGQKADNICLMSDSKNLKRTGCSFRCACLTDRITIFIFTASVDCPSSLSKEMGNGKTSEVPMVWP